MTRRERDAAQWRRRARIHDLEATRAALRAIGAEQREDEARARAHWELRASEILRAAMARHRAAELGG